VGGHRWKNVPRLDDYLGFDDEGFAPIMDHEPPDAKRALAERIMTGLRLAEGLPAFETILSAEFPTRAADRLRARVRAHVERAHMTDSDGRWRLTDAGFLLADGIAGDLMAALD